MLISRNVVVGSLVATWDGEVEVSVWTMTNSDCEDDAAAAADEDVLLAISVSDPCREEGVEDQVDIGSGTTRMDVMDQVVFVLTSSILPTELSSTLEKIPKLEELIVVVMSEISEVLVGELSAAPPFPIPAQNPPTEL